LGNHLLAADKKSHPALLFVISFSLQFPSLSRAAQEAELQQLKPPKEWPGDAV